MTLIYKITMLSLNVFVYINNFWKDHKFYLLLLMEILILLMINDFANKYRRKSLLVTTLKYLTANIFVSFLCSEILHNISRVRSVEDTNKSVTKFFQQLNNDEFLGKLLETFLIVSNICKCRTSQNNGFTSIASFLDFIFVCNCVTQNFCLQDSFSVVFFCIYCNTLLVTFMDIKLQKFSCSDLCIWKENCQILVFIFFVTLLLYSFKFIRFLSLVFNFFSSPLPIV